MRGIKSDKRYTETLVDFLLFFCGIYVNINLYNNDYMIYYLNVQEDQFYEVSYYHGTY